MPIKSLIKWLISLGWLSVEYEATVNQEIVTHWTPIKPQCVILTFQFWYNLQKESYILIYVYVHLSALQMVLFLEFINRFLTVVHSCTLQSEYGNNIGATRKMCCILLFRDHFVWEWRLKKTKWTETDGDNLTPYYKLNIIRNVVLNAA